MESNLSIVKVMVQDYCQKYFDNMPAPSIRIGNKAYFDKHNNDAHYDQNSGLIEISPEAASDALQLSKIKDTVKHELVHAWLDWKGLDSDDYGGHGAWFLWKAHKLGLDIHYLFNEYPDLEDVWERIQIGWKPEAEIEPPPLAEAEPETSVVTVQYQKPALGPGPNVIDVADLPFGEIPDLRWDERYITKEDFERRRRRYPPAPAAEPSYKPLPKVEVLDVPSGTALVPSVPFDARGVKITRLPNGENKYTISYQDAMALWPEPPQKTKSLWIPIAVGVSFLLVIVFGGVLFVRNSSVQSIARPNPTPLPSGTIVRRYRTVWRADLLREYQEELKNPTLSPERRAFIEKEIKYLQEAIEKAK